MPLNSSNKFITAIPAFALEASNDVYAVSSRFLDDELLAIREAIYPYGGTMILSDIIFNGVPTAGQRLDVYAPLVNGHTESHLLTLSKVAVRGPESSYEVEYVPTGASVPSNNFSSTLKTFCALLKNSSSFKSSQPNNSYNG